MIARWTAVAIILVTLLLVVAFVSPVLWNRESESPDNGGAVAAANSDTQQLRGRAGPWSVQVELAQGPAGAVALVLTVVDEKRAPASLQSPPTAALAMAGMGVQPVALSQEATGRWRGTGQTNMNGRWNLQIAIGDNTVELPVDIAGPN